MLKTYQEYFSSPTANCLMFKSYKYRLYPTKQQSILLDKHFGCCRFVYNLALEVKQYAWQTQRKDVSCYDLLKQITDLKNDCEWLREVDSQALQQSVINMDNAYKNFFKKRSDFPKYKKRSSVQSFRNPHGCAVEIKDGKLYQPKFRDGVKIIIDREIEGEIRSTTISKTPTGKYFVSVLVDNKKEAPKPKEIKEETTIGIDLGLNGIDLGLKDFCILSDGTKIKNPKHLKQHLSHLKFLQRQTSKKKKGSNNRKKANHKVALCHEKIANQRKDFLHKLSTQLIKNHDTLCFEDLNVQGMSASCKPKQDENGKYLPNGQSAKSGLNKSILDASWSMFLFFCEYKATWNGKNVLNVDRFYPSTKECNKCHCKNVTLTLEDRFWICANCITLHDRDINAAINIKNNSLKDCGGIHREKSVELPTIVGAMKQKITKF
jgi:putative transposase